jgi:hypothetical protein
MKGDNLSLNSPDARFLFKTMYCQGLKNGMEDKEVCLENYVLEGQANKVLKPLIYLLDALLT